MTSVSKLYLVTGCSLSMIPSGFSSTLLLDNFSAENFQLEHPRPFTDTKIHLTPLTDRRIVTAAGLPDWSVDFSDGVVHYTVVQESSRPYPGRNYLRFSYSNSAGPINLGNFQAFAIDVTVIRGSGRLRGFVNRPDFDDPIVPITTSGTHVYPFSNFDTSMTGNSLSAIDLLAFQISSETQDFEVIVDNFRLIPEPSTSLLLAISLIGIFSFRRRN
jgi:hypothetical protein